MLIQRRVAKAAALMVAAIGLVACSHPRTASLAAASGSGDSGSLTAIVQCFRTHGAPSFPDPVYDPGDGRWHFAISPAGVPMATRQACQSLLPVSTPSPAIAQADFQQLVTFAGCMRQQGISDWPDPGPDGYFHIDARLTSLGKRGGVYQAMQACHIPASGLNIVPAA